ncbi:hypothetical protein GTP41_15660 [Pseudoduganella sp. DS3]|uniref:Uncharacterized protein n=1 Tax=Pseudoduganella guangdongensis TaxID=2692179 RepID=A0A6N9HK43_9BURK|nr:hypothetical protein [Pseudoduganella guangdongensis]MYN03533.1 hypothetical protein [Pseudoduganella guangdongensis]
MQKYQHYVFAMLLACAAAGTGAQEATPSVEVQGVKNPDMRSYRAVVAGLEAFEKHRALAPAVPELRFRLAPRSSASVEQDAANAAAEEPLYLRIVGNGDPIPVPIAADGTFSVPRVQSAIDDDADLILNRKKGVLKGRPEVRTPGLPDNVRRLGDLRLECQVMVAIAKKEVGLMLTLFVNTVAMTSNWCDISVDKKKINFTFASLRMIDGAEMVDGERRKTLETGDFGFQVPLGEVEWSDNARIELRYAPELTADEKANPWLQALFVSGSINERDQRSLLRKLEDGIYVAELELEKGTHSLKAGTRGLHAINLGTANEGEKRQLAQDVAAPLVQRGKSLKLKVEHAGRYAVTLDARDKQAPTLRVARLP